MSIESVPQDNKPNFEPEYDVMRELNDAQATYEGMDEFDQYTWAIYKCAEINEELSENPAHALLEISAFTLEPLSKPGEAHSYARDGRSFDVQGYIAAVYAGKGSRGNGFIAQIIARNVFYQDPQTGENLEVGIHAPLTNIGSYKYLPLE
jgi:hypothetical protein